MHALPTLLLIHGFPLDHSMWQPNVGPLSNVAKVMAPDLLNITHAAEAPGVLTMEHFAGQLKELLNREGVDKAVLCGLSMGGYVALAFLERWPERVAGLILCNTRSTADTSEAKQGREQTALDALEKGSAVIARAMAPKLISDRSRSDHPELTQRLEAMIARQHPEAIAAASRGMALRPDRTELLQKTAIPVLVITGTEDDLMPPGSSEAMAEAAGAKLARVPKAGHLSNLEGPEEFNTAVVEFLHRFSK